MDAPRKAAQVWELEDSSSDSEPSQQATDLQWGLKTTLETELEAMGAKQNYQSALSRRVRNVRQSRGTVDPEGGDRPTAPPIFLKIPNTGIEKPAEDECLIPAAEVQQKLTKILDSFERVGPIGLHHKIDNPPSPGLFINGFGDVVLPISPLVADLIRAVGTQNPLQKGVSKFQGVPGGLLEMRNPGWNKLITGLLESLASEVGVGTAEIEAVEPCLILCDPGCERALNQCDENSHLTFGYLDVLLSTSSVGDEVKIQHGTTQISVSTSGVSPNGCFFLAWLLDVAVTYPVSTSSQIVLRYQLIHKRPSMFDFTARLTRGGSELPVMLKSWKTEYNKMNRRKLAYLLQYTYSDTDLTFSKLKGRDRTLVAKLIDVGKPAGVSIYLGNVERTSRGAPDLIYTVGSSGHHKMSEIDYDTYEISHVAALDGIEPLSTSRIPLSVGHFMSDIYPFYSVTCDAEIFDAKENFLQKTSRRSVILLMPEETQEANFVRSPLAIVDLFINRYRTSIYDPIRDYGAIWACRTIIDGTTWTSFKTIYSNKTIIKAIHLIDLIDNEELLESALPLSFLSPELFEALKLIARKRGNDWLPTKIATQLSKLEPFSVRCQAIIRFSKFYPDECWVNEQYSLAIKSLPLVSPEDGDHMKKVISLWAEHPYLKDVLYCAVVLPTTSFTAKMKFLSGILTTKKVPLSALQLYLAEYTQSSFPKSIVLSEPLLEAQSLAEIFAYGSALFQKEFSSEFALIMSKLIAAAEDSPVARLEKFCLPMLQSIAQSSWETDESNRSRLAPLFQSTLSSWIYKFMLLIPAPPQDRVRQKLGCGNCINCTKIDAFLASTEKIVYEAEYPYQSIIAHLKSRLTKKITEESSLEVSTSRRNGCYKLVIKKTSLEDPEMGMVYDRARRELRKSIQNVFVRCQRGKNLKTGLLGKHQRQIYVLNLPVPASEIELPK